VLDSVPDIKERNNVPTDHYLVPNKSNSIELKEWRHLGGYKYMFKFKTKQIIIL
jgi:hypothetical protein